MKLSKSLGCVGGLALICSATALFAQSKPAPAAAPKTSAALIDHARPIMQAEEVAAKGTTPVFSDQSKAGPYILRTKLAANQAVRPHYDDQDRFITVLEGTLWVGRGDVFNPSVLMPIREGGVMYLPANTHYFQVAGGEADVLLQITGNGPVKSVHTEVDAKGQPVAENGPYPNLNPPAKKRGYVDPDLLTPEQIEQMEREAAAAKAAAAKRATEKPAAEKPAAEKPATAPAKK